MAPAAARGTHERLDRAMKPLLTILLLTPLAVLHAAQNNPKRPNILWLAGENIKLDLGCYGEKLVRTPNLDRLAAEGVRYTRVFTTNPACAQPLGVLRRHVSDHHRHAPHAVPPR